MKRITKAGIATLMGGLLLTIAITGNININHKKKFDEKLLAATSPMLPEVSWDKYAKIYMNGETSANTAYANSDIAGTGFYASAVSASSMGYDEATRYVEQMSPKSQALAYTLPNEVASGVFDTEQQAFSPTVSGYGSWWNEEDASSLTPRIAKVSQVSGIYQRPTEKFEVAQEGRPGKCVTSNFTFLPGTDVAEENEYQLSGGTNRVDEDELYFYQNFYSHRRIGPRFIFTSADEFYSDSVWHNNQTLYVRSEALTGCHAFTNREEASAYAKGTEIDGTIPQGTTVTVSEPRTFSPSPSDPLDTSSWDPYVLQAESGGQVYFTPQAAQEGLSGKHLSDRLTATHPLIPDMWEDNLVCMDPQCYGPLGSDKSGYAEDTRPIDTGVLFLTLEASKKPLVVCSRRETSFTARVTPVTNTTGQDMQIQFRKQDAVDNTRFAEATGFRYQYWDGTYSEEYGFGLFQSLDTYDYNHRLHACAGGKITPGKHGVRPTLTLNPSSVIFASTPSNGQEIQVTPLLDERPTTKLTANQGYTLTIKDDRQQVTRVSERLNDHGITAEAKERVVRVKPRAATINMDVEASYSPDAGTNYITAMGIDVTDSNIVKIGRLAKATSDTTEVTLDLTNLIADRNTVGNSAKVLLYTEQMHDANETNTISATPYEIEIVIVDEQTLDFDAATKAEFAKPQTYGTPITIGAEMTSSSWDATTPMVFSLEGTDAANYASITDQNWNKTTGKLTATLTYLKPGVMDLRLKVSKAGTDIYTSAEKISSVITINKRKIALLVDPKTQYVGDPFNLSSDIKITESLLNASGETIAGTAVVSGDTSPYHVTVEKLADPAVTELPTTDGKLNADAEGIWKILLKGDTAAIDAFDEKYEVVLKDYLENATKIIEVKPLNFRLIVNDNFTKQPQSSTVIDGESFAFSAEIIYPITKGDAGEDKLTAEEQQLSYKIQKKVNGETAYQDVTGGVFHCNDELGILTVNYKSDAVSSTDHLSAYRVLVWNQKNKNSSVSDNVEDYAAISKEAVLQVTTNPATLVNVPSAIECRAFGDVIKDADISESGVITEADTKIQLENTNASLAGNFRIMTDPEVSMVKESKKTYTLDVLKSDGSKLSSDNLLMTLNKDHKSESFNLSGVAHEYMEIGTYKGIMTFTIKYETGSPVPK